MKNSNNITFRPISEIANEIVTLWTKVDPAASPYLLAMCYLQTMDDKYAEDSASYCVAYFLGNATSWKGEDARRIKKELHSMLDSHNKRNK